MVNFSTGQIDEWLEKNLREHLAERALSGQPLPADSSFVTRQVGRAAASGCRQILITCQDKLAARVCMDIVHKWWTYVPEEVDPEGWRWCGVRWFTP